MTQPDNNIELDDTAPASAPLMRSTDHLGHQPQFILRDEQARDSAIRLGGSVHFLSMDHLNEPLYEIVAEPGNAEPAAVLAHLYDRDTDQLWQLRDVHSGRTVHSDLQLRGWSHAEEIAVADPAEALRLANEFGRKAHESGIPPVPELDANYVTAVTVWPQITDDLKRDWLDSWFETSYRNPGLWEDIDWTTELDGSRYAGMAANQALTVAAMDLEIAVKAALPRHMLPTPDSVRDFLHGERIAQEANDIAAHLSSVETAFASVDLDRMEDRAAYTMDPAADLEKFDAEYESYSSQLENTVAAVEQQLDTYLREHRDVLGDNPRWRSYYESIDRDNDARRDGDIDTASVDAVPTAAVMEAAMGPLTPPSGSDQTAAPTAPQGQPARESSRAPMPYQQQDQSLRGR